MHPKEVAALFAGLLFLSLISSYFIGVNRFSMHALYRDRLIRAYLGASNDQRKPQSLHRLRSRRQPADARAARDATAACTSST